MSESIEDKKIMRDKLRAILLTGARRVSHNGKTVEFHSVTEIKSMIADLDMEIDRAAGCRMKRTIFVRTV